MQLMDLLASSHSMQAIHILRDESELRIYLFHFNQREMSRIRPNTLDRFASPRVPVPDKFGIAGKCLGRGQVGWIILFPKSGLSVAESTESALLGNPCPR